MTHPYKTREGGATVTIFVPYDCRNHCPFCVNKQEYAHAEGFSVEAILKSIAVMDEITPRCDFVFTGGEPFANLKALQRMLDAIPTTHKDYINTTFPVQPGCSAEEMIAFTERNRDKITCINISRHLTKYVEESPDEVVARIATPKRVNCVLYMDYPADELVDYAERWRKYNIPVQFRYDYTETTPENLYQEEGDKILADLKKRFTYKGLDGGLLRAQLFFDRLHVAVLQKIGDLGERYVHRAQIPDGVERLELADAVVAVVRRRGDVFRRDKAERLVVAQAAHAEMENFCHFADGDKLGKSHL